MGGQTHTSSLATNLISVYIGSNNPETQSPQRFQGNSPANYSAFPQSPQSTAGNVELELIAHLHDGGAA